MVAVVKRVTGLGEPMAFVTRIEPFMSTSAGVVVAVGLVCVFASHLHHGTSAIGNDGMVVVVKRVTGLPESTAGSTAKWVLCAVAMGEVRRPSAPSVT